MPISFGSVGDVISVCLLVKDLVEALDKSRGSSAEYQGVIQELTTLDRALLEVELLCRKYGNTAELQALLETGRQTVDKCQKTVQSFTERIRKYGPTLSEGGSRNAIKDAAMKIRWQASGKEGQIAKFRAEISAYTNSIHMLLATAHMKMMKANGEQITVELTNTEARTHKILRNQEKALDEIRYGLKENNKLVSASLTARVADSLRLRWIAQLGVELKSFMANIITINIATYHAVVSLGQCLPSHPERTLIDKPFILEDPIGRIAPVHMTFVDSWEAFDAVMELRFKDLQGLGKIRTREYVMQEHSSRREILRTRSFKHSFLPGHRYDMSLLFQQDSTENPTTSCPGCQIETSGGSDTDTQCSGCGMYFRRITEIQEVEPPPAVPLPSPWKAKVRFGESAFGPVVPPPMLKKRKREESGNDDQDEPHEFKRVRVISKQKRVKKNNVPSFQTQDTMRWPSSTASENSGSWILPGQPTVVDGQSSCPSVLQTTWKFAVDHIEDLQDFNDSEGEESGTDFDDSDGGPETDRGFDDSDDEGSRTGSVQINQNKDDSQDDRNNSPAQANGAISPSDDKHFGGSNPGNHTVGKSEDNDGKHVYSYFIPKNSHSNEDNHPRYEYYYSPYYTYTSTSSPTNSPKFSPHQPSQDYCYTTYTDLSDSAHFTPLPIYESDESSRYSHARARRTRTASPTACSPRKATEEDARRVGIPAGYSYQNWDPTEEPVMFVGSVFDANSLGKFIYDWTIFSHGPAHPISDMAGELWLLLIQLAGKVKRIEENFSRIRSQENKEMVEDFLESGERLWIRFGKLLKVCEDYICKAVKKENGGDKPTMGRKGGIELINTIFGKDKELEKTEKFMTGARLWSIRFDATCEEILKNPSA